MEKLFKLYQILVLWIVMLSLFRMEVLAQCEIKLLANDRDPEDIFGNSVCVSGDRAIIGAPQEDTGGNNTGAAYVYERDASGNWVEVAKLQASDREAGALFGGAVSISGDHIIVGARYRDLSYVDAGAAYIFERDGNGVWNQVQRLQASDKYPKTVGDQFGVSVSIRGNYAIVGAPLRGANDQGAAYIFERNANGIWNQVRFLSTLQKGYHFGWSVSISESYAIIGVPNDDFIDPCTLIPKIDIGSAFIYKRCSGEWKFDQKLIPFDCISSIHSSAFDNFGWSVSIDGNRAIIGQKGNDITIPFPIVNVGAAYVYERVGSVCSSPGGFWHLKNRLRAFPAGGGNEFGFSVSIDGDKAIVGEWQDDDLSGFNVGSAHIFQRNNSGFWVLVRKLQASDKKPGDKFGISVSISDNLAIVGARYQDDNNSNSNYGAAYLYDMNYSINNLEAGSQTTCNPMTNTYSQDIIVTYCLAPPGGSLVVNGQSFPIQNSPQTVTLTNLFADCKLVDVTAYFSDYPSYILTKNDLFSAPMDCQVPIITCPEDIMKDNDPDACGAIVNYEEPDGIDICPGAVTSRTSGLGSGALFPVGTTVEEYTVIDATGKMASCSFKIVIADVQEPQITCPGNITVNNDPGDCGAMVNYTPPVGTDNCPGAVTERTGGLGSGSFFPVGVTVEEYKVTDPSGNSVTCSFTITVADNEPPVITTITDPISLWPPNHKYQPFSVEQFISSVEDNCDGSIDISKVIITSVSSDEPEDLPGEEDGNTLNDMVITLPCDSVKLRKERDETANGRVYTIHFAVEDANGNIGESDFQVTVPIDQSGIPAINDGGIYTVNGACSIGLAKIGDEDDDLIEENTAQLTVPKEFSIMQNYPNPFNPSTTIRYELPGKQFVRLNVYNTLGQEVAQLVNEYQEAGVYEVNFDAANFPSGVYIYKITAGKFSETRKMLLMK